MLGFSRLFYLILGIYLYVFWHTHPHTRLLMSGVSTKWGLSLSRQMPSCALSLITTMRWLADAVVAMSQCDSSWQLVEETIWSQQTEWPRETKADVRILALTPQTALSDQCLAAVEQSKRSLPTLALMTHHDELWMKRVLRDHAVGYLTLEQSQDEFRQAVTHLRAGDSYVPQRYIKALMGESPAVAKRLSEREKAIAKLLVSGASHREIAKQLHISDKTVSTHKNNILERLELKHLPDLVRFHDQHPFAFKT